MENEALATRLGNRDDMRMAHPDDLRQLLALVTKNAGNISNLDEIAIDTDSAAFKALSAEDQHDLIVALKVRSRQTSHNRLQAMLESSNTSMDFSKQQISNLVKRNNLTQQWLEVTGAGHRVTALAPGQVTSGRVASERNREYTLIKSSQPGGGWTLKMSGGGAAKEEIEEGTPSNEIMISSDEEDVDAEYDSDAFEDVDIENEQPRFHAPEAPAADQIGYSSHLHQPHQPHQPQNIVLRQPGPDGTNATSYANTQPTGASVAPAHLQPHGLGSAHPTHIVQDAVPVSGNAAEYPDVQQMAATGPSPMASSFDDLAIESDGSSALASNDLDYGNYESNSEAAGSDIEANANLLALYGDYGQLEELHRKREEEIRQQREREEYTIVAMSVQDFLNIWMNLATPAMLDADPFIRVNMQRWLLEERLDSLRMMAHKASRQFEKQPELDLEEPELDGAVLDVDAYEEVQQLRVRVSTLALLSNYLSYAVKWREAREMPAQQPQVHQVVEPEAISDTGSPEVIALESSSLLAGSDLPRGMTQFADEPEAAHDEQRKRDLVFAKAELFAQDSADILPQTKKHRATDITVHNIDNDSEDDVDGSVAIVEQQASDADIGKSECKASEDSAIALDAKSAEHDDDDDDEAAMDQQQAELMRNEQD
ncbi:DNA repair protein rad2, partial [Linderina pennispora]